MKTLRVKTPAKINLTLEVLGKRDDGYHEISSIMQAVNLYDYLNLTLEDSEWLDISISGNSREIPYNHTNLAYTAAQKFFKTLGSNYSLKIEIEKNIPVKSGLAGGSSNAAGVLYGLNKLLDKPFSSAELLEMSASIGSDVAFCLFGGTQIATSRGEVLEKINTPNLKIMAIKPKKLSISAKEAYDKYDDFGFTARRNSTMKMLSFINKNEDITDIIHNDLEFPISRSYPEIKQLKEYMVTLGCNNPTMSGSGPTVFGVLDAQDDINVPKNIDAECFIAKTIQQGVRVVNKEE